MALVWRTLRSMRTALVLLLLLALASVAGSLLPQAPNSPERVVDYLADHPVWGELFLRAGFFDVFGSWWFTLVTVLLFVSLVSCLIPRSRAHWRALRSRPMQAREIDAFKRYAERRVTAPPADAAAIARKVLRRRGFRVAADPTLPALAAEKGLVREAGSLVFHWAFVLLLVAVVVGKGTGYTGQARIVEGETFTDASFNYAGQLRAGRFFDGDHSGAQVTLIDYRDAFGDTGVPMDFQSEVRFTSDDGATTRTEVIRVNHPAVFDGVRYFQFGFGWAPVVEVVRNGTTVREDAIPFVQRQTAPEGVSQLAMPWNGSVKLPATDDREPSHAIELTLWPDGRALAGFVQTGDPIPMTTEFDPVLQYTLWEGTLTDLSLAGLDTSGMRRVADGLIGADQTVDLERGCVVGIAPAEDRFGTACDPGAPAGLTMRFPDLRQFTVLQVSRDATVPYVLGAAILILVGLLPALYVSRRKIWVRADPDGAGSMLKVGGFALQRKERFEEEFAKLVDALATATGGASAHEREMVGT
ncbi:MAG TPA: cytochrome c biogenesis protein ResB [Actinomycetota bacterium]|nr:cytochrome c biogenesis protein ResB [Actinomycetota bacterium]